MPKRLPILHFEVVSHVFQDHGAGQLAKPPGFSHRLAVKRTKHKHMYESMADMIYDIKPCDGRAVFSS